MFSMAGRGNLVLLVVALLVPCVVDSQFSTAFVDIQWERFQGTRRNIVVNYNRIPVETYWRIPYSVPRVGLSRFARPYTFFGRFVRMPTNATVPPKACFQKVDHQTIHSYEDMSEDCLYYSVWRPHCNTADMATLVYIHGGSLRSGYSANPLYNGEYLAAKQCVIVASFNYRLGALGFLPIDTYNSKSNAGLYDVKLALRVIRMNIWAFSGSPNKITVFGSGTGAFLASTFVFSSYRVNNVNSVILQSGSPTMQMLYQSRASAMVSAVRLATNLSCDTTHKQAMVNCLRNIDARVLTEAFYRTIDGFRYRMVAVMDGTIITRDPIEYLKNQEINNVSVMIGTNKDDATESLMKLLPLDFNSNALLPPVLSDRKINETLRTFLGMLYRPQYMPLLTTLSLILYDYENLNRTENSSLAFLSTLTHDLAYTCPMRLVLDAYAAVLRDAYVYSFNHGPDNTSLPAWVGATHGAELAYIFGNSASFSPREIALSDTMQTMWANFAKYGNPTPDNSTGIQWPPYTSQTSERMLVFKQDTQINVSEVNTENCWFWNAIPKDMKVG